MTTIGELMAKAIVAGHEETVGEVREKLSSYDISAAPVVDEDGVLLGIVTADDLVRSYPATIPISRIMSSPVHTLPPSADAAEAGRLMLKRRQHHVVVLDDSQVVGIVSSLDLLRLVPGVS